MYVGITGNCRMRSGRGECRNNQMMVDSSFETGIVTITRTDRDRAALDIRDEFLKIGN